VRTTKVVAVNIAVIAVVCGFVTSTV
jgi:hypothetical protein